VRLQQLGAEALKLRIRSAIEGGAFRKIDEEMALQVLWGAITAWSR